MRRQKLIPKDPAALVVVATYPDLFCDKPTPILKPGVAECIECGCTDEAPCSMLGCCCGDGDEPSCEWIWVDRSNGLGLCSECGEGGC